MPVKLIRQCSRSPLSAHSMEQKSRIDGMKKEIHSGTAKARGSGRIVCIKLFVPHMGLRVHVLESLVAMASKPNNLAPEPYEGRDFAIDEIPIFLRDDCMVKYFRCRFLDRDECIKEFDDDKQNRIIKELDRIRELRKTFNGAERTRPSIEMFKYRQACWRNNARKTSQQDLEKLLETKIAMQSQEHQPKTESKIADFNAKIVRVDLEIVILQAARSSEWIKEPPSAKPKELEDAEAVEEEAKLSFLDEFLNIFKKPQVDMARLPPKLPPKSKPGSEREFTIPRDSYGISVTQVKLKKDPAVGDLSSFTYDTTTRSELKDILEGANGNPLKRIEGTDVIRYFHIPANNMHWVEVSPHQ